MHFTNEQQGRLLALIKKFPKNWDAKSAICELKDADYHWRQMEWIGWYFQFLCRERLGSLMQIPWEEKKVGPGGGTVEFDGFLGVPWDFKAHPIFDKHGKISEKVAGNDSKVTAAAINKYGWVGIILALGEATFNDEDRSFQKWHTALKGGKSDYEIEREARGASSRLRKTKFVLKEVQLIKVTDETLSKFGTFQEGFRNSNGRPRRAKILIKTSSLSEEIVGRVVFD